MAVNALSDLHIDRLAAFYKNKTIFLTGGTGFVGKVLIEKFLRCCSEFKLIYVLIRSKRGKDEKDRLEEVLSGPLFDKVKKERGIEIMKKIKPIFGDATAPDLGLSTEDRRKLINEVEIVYHCAASVRFDDPLQFAIFLNVRCTKLMIELAKEMKKLLVFVHVSTAYCQPNEQVLYEQPYDPPANPHDVIQIAELLTDEMLQTITNKILGNIPNGYVYTKALAEALIVAEMDKLPVIITRPSIILPIWKEPLPGWTNTINGLSGVLLAAGKGVLRTMYCDENVHGNLVPVDLIINAMMTCTFDFIKNKKRRIYNLTSSREDQITWKQVVDLGRNVMENQLPLNWVAWYPGGSMKSSKIVHYVCFVLFHILPAVFVDTVLVLLAQKPILIRVQRRIFKGFQMLEFYANSEWDFNNDHLQEAKKSLNEKEKSLYSFDARNLDHKEYYYNCIHGTRLYLLKETDDTIRMARRHLKVMWCVDKIAKFLLISCFCYYILYLRIFVPIFRSK